MSAAQLLRGPSSGLLRVRLRRRARSAGLVAALVAALAMPAAGAVAQERPPDSDAAGSGARVAASTGTIVWSKGGQVWAMDDDGTNARVLVPLSATPGMERLAEPAVHPSGSVVAFTGSTTANRVVSYSLCGPLGFMYPCNTTHYGFNHVGTYRWQDGLTVRLSAAPAYGFETSSGDDGPEPRADGHLVYRTQICTGTYGAGTYECVGAVKSTSGEAYPTCDSVADPSPNPVAPGEVVVTGCMVGADNALLVTGPSGSGQRVIGCDDVTQSDPSWSPAGDQVVAAEGGVDPGLWVYGASNSDCYGGSLRHAVVAPTDVTFDSPRFIGTSRIVFEANGDLWTVPASCNGCAFPAQATQLTTGGDSSDPAWTSATVPPPGGPTDPQDPGSADPAPVLDLRATAKRQKVARSRAVVVRLQVSEAVGLKASGKVKVLGKDPRLVKRAALAAGASSVKVRLSGKAFRAVRWSWRLHAKVVAVLRVRVTDSAGSTTSRTVRVRLVR